MPGRAFTRRMYAKFAAGSSNLKQHHHVRRDGEFKNDCRVWEKFLSTAEEMACRPFIDLNRTLKADVLRFFTDAAKGKNLGFGGIFGNHWIIGKWEAGFIAKEDPSIEFLELYGVMVAVVAWAGKLRNQRIVLFCDNSSVVSMINNMTSSCKQCMKLIRLLTLESLKNNMRVFARWVRGSLNQEADFLSRQEVTKFKAIMLDAEEKPAKLPKLLWPLSKFWELPY